MEFRFHSVNPSGELRKFHNSCNSQNLEGHDIQEIVDNLLESGKEFWHFPECSWLGIQKEKNFSSSGKAWQKKKINLSGEKKHWTGLRLEMAEWSQYTFLKNLGKCVTFLENPENFQKMAKYYQWASTFYLTKYTFSRCKCEQIHCYDNLFK